MGNECSAYTNRFQELALICTKFVSTETKKVTKYISGLLFNIYGTMCFPNKSLPDPKIVNETIELAQRINGPEDYALSRRDSLINKRKADDILEQPTTFQKQNRRAKHTSGTAEKKKPMKEMAQVHQVPTASPWPCTLKCHKCGKIGHYARDCRSTDNTNATNNRGGNGPNPKGNGCFECGNQGHFKRDCPKLKNKN
ncbi:reverse transcriptase domain-containing protein [Tanacetum coccineum]|uniref:Reverse transcriptase domain-containing protein n=1 Tax=Tanacetum coccineum TaxID=301880 RepID=A0ABQ5F2Z6_9ASTR